MERNTILGIGCGVIFVALVGCVIFGMAVGSDDDNDVHVSGRVSISPAFTAACENAKVVITPQGLSARTIRFEAKSWRFGQGCVFEHKAGSVSSRAAGPAGQRRGRGVAGKTRRQGEFREPVAATPRPSDPPRNSGVFPSSSSAEGPRGE